MENEQGINRSGASDSVNMYFTEVGRVELLTPEEEKELATRMKDGDEAAWLRFCEANLRLVVSIAMKYVNRGLPLEDLIQAGNLGLIKAVERYNVRKGFRFSTYAPWWIRRSIQDAIRKEGPAIRLPEHIVKSSAKIRSADFALTQELRREPSAEEIADFAGMDVMLVREILSVVREPLSLDMPVGEEDNQCLLDYLSESMYRWDDEWDDEEDDGRGEEIRQILEQLTDRERTVLILRYGIGPFRAMSLAEIAEIFGVSRERIRQIQKRAIQKIQDAMASEEVQDDRA